MNKKILAILMALLMVLMSSVALAAGDGTVDATFNKVYTKEGSTAVAPAETFSFVVGAGSVEGASAGVTAPDASNIEISNAAFTADDTLTVNVDVNLAAFTETGAYTYPVTETQGTLASVTYDATLEVVVLVQYDAQTDSIVKAVYVKAGGEKDVAGTEIENKYTAGSLKISKTVTGAYGDPNKYFTITVTLTGEEGKTYEGVAMTAAGGKAENSKNLVIGDNTFEIKHGETITLSNLPSGVSYTVTEADYTGEGYDAPVYTGNTGDIATTEEDTCSITNNKDGDDDIETGVFTDNMPYFMLLAFVMILAAAVVLKKRTVNE